MGLYHFIAIITALLGIVSLTYGLTIRVRLTDDSRDGSEASDHMFAIPSEQVYQRRGWVKAGLFLIMAAGMLELWNVGIPSFGTGSFPAKKDFQSFSYELEHGRTGQVPEKKLQQFLKQIRNPRDVYQAVMVENFFTFLSALYRKTGDENILLAVDQMPIHGDAAGLICGFYARILRLENARIRYRANRLPVQRCIGISISPEEYKALIE